MALASYLVFFFLISHQLLLSLSERDYNPRCPPFSCGHLSSIGFPFSNRTHPECGLLIVDNCTQPDHQSIQLANNKPFFYIKEIAQDNTLELHDQPFPIKPDNTTCKSFINLIFPRSPFISFNITYLPPGPHVFKCPHTGCAIPKNYSLVCNDTTYSIIKLNPPNFNPPWNTTPPARPATPDNCSVYWPRVTKTQKRVVFHDIFTGMFSLQVNVTRECYECHWRGGQCQSDRKGNFYCKGTGKIYINFHDMASFVCFLSNRVKDEANFGFVTVDLTLYANTILLVASTIGHYDLGRKLKLGIEIGVPTLLIGVLALYITWRCKNFHPRYISSDPSSKSDPEEASVYFGVPIFSYRELAEATNNFSHEKELGKGGFGTVYHGKLRNGRKVAVKRLYEHNYRSVEQFMNEIKILTRLRHKNLVSLFGCTSRQSQGLLLVYEFVSNSTIANHLHGDKANSCLLTWPIRMNIAIETALALAYLHASDIIHRDVKTNNILLDDNFSVKVVDFGLSRLFPTDVTHVSTAPQGTPGYVDPEYHQCYQLTNKSDVYSFGVVLIELISSMPAVDVSRDKHEINLANLAINKIQKRAVDELIDPCLGFHLDEEVKRMTTSVAELAFLCLQQTKEMRPSMDAVLEQLLRIKSREYKPEILKEEDVDDKEELKSTLQPPPPPLHYEETSLLETMEMAPSPISVTENWVSNSTTSYVSKYSTTSNVGKCSTTSNVSNYSTACNVSKYSTASNISN